MPYFSKYSILFDMKITQRVASLHLITFKKLYQFKKKSRHNPITKFTELQKFCRRSYVAILSDLPNATKKCWTKFRLRNTLRD